MNRERMKVLADHIEGTPHGESHPLPDERSDRTAGEARRIYEAMTDGMTFSMKDYLTSNGGCGTVGCIAAHAVLLWGEEANEDLLISEAAREILGLTEEEETRLFLPSGPGIWRRAYASITPAETARALRLAAGGMSARGAWHEVLREKGESE